MHQIKLTYYDQTKIRAVEYNKQPELKKASSLATVGPDNLKFPKYSLNVNYWIKMTSRYQTLLQPQELNKLWRKSGWTN